MPLSRRFVRIDSGRTKELEASWSGRLQTAAISKTRGRRPHGDLKRLRRRPISKNAGRRFSILLSSATLTSSPPARQYRGARCDAIWSVAEIDTVFILAVRGQKEAGYARNQV